MDSDTEMRDVGDLSEADSLASTVESEQASAYEVETVLAEENGLFLVKWANYPIHRATLEPPESFDSDDTLLQWEKKHFEIKAGSIPAFDLEAWKRDQERRAREKQTRKKARRAKRAQRAKRRIALLNHPGHVARPEADINPQNDVNIEEVTTSLEADAIDPVTPALPARTESAKRLSVTSEASSTLFVPEESPPSGRARKRRSLRQKHTTMFSPYNPHSSPIVPSTTSQHSHASLQDQASQQHNQDQLQLQQELQWELEQQPPQTKQWGGSHKQGEKSQEKEKPQRSQSQQQRQPPAPASAPALPPSTAPAPRPLFGFGVKQAQTARPRRLRGGEREPDVSQLELLRPSQFPAREGGANSAAFATIRSPNESRSLSGPGNTQFPVPGEPPAALTTDMPPPVSHATGINEPERPTASSVSTEELSSSKEQPSASSTPVISAPRAPQAIVEAERSRIRLGVKSSGTSPSVSRGPSPTPSMSMQPPSARAPHDPGTDERNRSPDSWEGTSEASSSVSNGTNNLSAPLPPPRAPRTQLEFERPMRPSDGRDRFSGTSSTASDAPRSTSTPMRSPPCGRGPEAERSDRYSGSSSRQDSPHRFGGDSYRPLPPKSREYFVRSDPRRGADCYRPDSRSPSPEPRRSSKSSRYRPPSRSPSPEPRQSSKSSRYRPPSRSPSPEPRRPSKSSRYDSCTLDSSSSKPTPAKNNAPPPPPIRQHPVPSSAQPPSTRDQASQYAEAQIARMPVGMPIPGEGKRTTEGYFWNWGEVLAHVYFGPEKKFIGAVRLCGMSENAKNDLLASKGPGRQFELWFKELCTVEEYGTLCEQVIDNKLCCNAWMEGFENTNAALFYMTEELRQKNLVAIYRPVKARGQVWLAYSRRSPDFSLLNWKTDQTPAGVPVFLAVRPPLPPITILRSKAIERPTTRGRRDFPANVHFRGGEVSPHRATALTSSTPEAITEKGEKVSHGLDLMDMTPDLQQPVTFSPPQVTSNALVPTSGLDYVPMVKGFFETNLGMTMAELATFNEGGADIMADNFYLHFPQTEEGKNEAQIIEKWLETYGAMIYTDWAKFLKNSKCGVIIFHESFSEYYDLRPRIREALWASRMNFWNVRLSRPLELPDQRYCKAGVHFQRLFPHGHAYLLTEDVFRDLQRTAVILCWFHGFQKKSPGAYKLVLYPDVMAHLHRRLKDPNTSKEDQNFLLTIVAWIQKANSVDSRNPHFQSKSLNTAELDEPNNNVLSLHIPGYGSRTEDEHPGIPKGLTQVERDADHLVEVFAGWTIINAARFRKTIVVTSMKNPALVSRWQSWGHVALYSVNKFFEYFRLNEKALFERVETGGRSGQKGGTSSSAPTPKTPVADPRTPKAPWDPLAGDNRSSSSHWRPPAKHNYPAPYQ